MARYLLEHGWKDVRPIKGGFDAWLRAGRPVEPRAGLEENAPDPQNRMPTVLRQ